jgi:hypothetical protein
VPVRGQVLGAECLSEVLGPDAPREEARAGEGPGVTRRSVVGAAFAVAFVSTLLPWSRFGEGSGPFGAWGRSPRWSVLAAVAATLGLALWALQRRLDLRHPAWGIVLSGLGGLVALGAVLALLRPPSFTRVWFAPWIAIGAGIVVVAASIMRRGLLSRPAERI